MKFSEKQQGYCLSKQCITSVEKERVRGRDREKGRERKRERERDTERRDRQIQTTD